MRSALLGREVEASATVSFRPPTIVARSRSASALIALNAASGGGPLDWRAEAASPEGAFVSHVSASGWEYGQMEMMREWREAVQESGAYRVLRIGAAVGEVLPGEIAMMGASAIPGVGEGMDAYSAVYGETALERNMARASLALNAITLGVAPNFGRVGRTLANLGGELSRLSRSGARIASHGSVAALKAAERSSFAFVRAGAKVVRQMAGGVRTAGNYASALEKGFLRNMHRAAVPAKELVGVVKRPLLEIWEAARSDRVTDEVGEAAARTIREEAHAARGFSSVPSTETHALGSGNFTSQVDGLSIGGASKIPGMCFVAGTVIATAAGPQPIETLQVGDRVLTNDRSAEVTQVDPVTWQTITLRMPNPEHEADLLDIELLRSPEWIEAVGCAEGARIWFELDEMGLHGWADVVEVAPCAPLQDGPGRVVLATVTHLNSFVLEIRLAGVAEPLHPTDRHRLYSVTRSEWIPASQLLPEEELATQSGSARVESIAFLPGTHRVHNLEVETDHCYYAGDSRVLSHNVNRCADPGLAAGSTANTASKIGPRKLPATENPWRAYQVHATGKHFEEMWRLDTQRIAADARNSGFFVEAKWAGRDAAAWRSSVYNPEHRYYDEAKVVSQASDYLRLKAASGGLGVRYAVSNEAARAHFESLFRRHFWTALDNGSLNVWHVPGTGM